MFHHQRHHHALVLRENMTTRAEMAEPCLRDPVPCSLSSWKNYSYKVGMKERAFQGLNSHSIFFWYKSSELVESRIEQVEVGTT